MSKKIKCEVCHGWGTLKDEIICPRCNGRKVIREKHDGHSRLILQTCPACKGEGKYRPICNNCGGDGWYKLKEEKVRIGNKRRY